MELDEVGQGMTLFYTEAQVDAAHDMALEIADIVDGQDVPAVIIALAMINAQLVLIQVSDMHEQYLEIINTVNREFYDLYVEAMGDANG